MEIEADLYGAWLLGRKGLSLSNGIQAFDDSFKMGKGLGEALGDPDENAPHHPWAEQRHLALAKAGTLSVLHPSISEPQGQGKLYDHGEKTARAPKEGRIG